ncbi:MAG: hypothetical protein QHI48_09375 [Bacteroidota bacterium]|nr:hypothetical protein [Bacteroidota bacterium]
MRILRPQARVIGHGATPPAQDAPFPLFSNPQSILFIASNPFNEPYTLLEDRMNAQTRIRLGILACALAAFSCSQVRDFTESLKGLAKCTFKLDSISDFRLMGIPLSGKTSLSDFNLVDAGKLATAFAQGTFPASFTLNVAAINPNDGREGKFKTPATITGFPWTLILDNTTTIEGDIASPVTLPSTGEQTIIPLRMDLDLARFFRDKGYESIVNLALALGGVNGSPARVTLKARPRIKTDFGEIAYPGVITIVDKEFRAQ